MNPGISGGSRFIEEYLGGLLASLLIDGGTGLESPELRKVI
jgi:hypothetical protein